MSAATILHECLSVGLALSLDGEGNIDCTGEKEAISRLLPEIKAHKPEILRLLTTAGEQTHEDRPAIPAGAGTAAWNPHRDVGQRPVTGMAGAYSASGTGAVGNPGESAFRSTDELFEDIREYVGERAGVLEYEQGFPRKEAEQEAIRRAVVKYRLNEFYGDPPKQGGGVVMGREDETVEDVIEGLRRRYGNRLLETKP